MNSLDVSNHNSRPTGSSGPSALPQRSRLRRLVLLSALMGEMAALLTCGTVFTVLNVAAYAKSRALRGV